MTHIGITMGDSSGVGPEILLKAAHENSIPVPYVVYGDLAPLAKLNEQYNLTLHPIAHPADAREGDVLRPVLDSVDRNSLLKGPQVH